MISKRKQISALQRGAHFLVTAVTVVLRGVQKVSSSLHCIEFIPPKTPGGMCFQSKTYPNHWLPEVMSTAPLPSYLLPQWPI